MTQAHCFSCIALALASTLALPHRTGQAEERRLENRLPSSTIVCVSVGSFKEAWAEFRRTDLGKTGFGDHFDAFRKELVEADKASMLHLRPWWGFDWDDLKDIDSEAALVVVRNNQDLGAAWWFQGDPMADHLKKLRSTIDDYFEKEKKLVSTTGKFGEADWAAHVTREGDDPVKAAVGPIWVTTDQGVYVASDWKTAEVLANSYAESKANPPIPPAIATALESIYSEGEPGPKARLRLLVRPPNIALAIRRPSGRKRLDFWSAFWKRVCSEAESIGLTIDLAPGRDEEIRAAGAIVFKPAHPGKVSEPILMPTTPPEVPEFVPPDIGSAMKFGINPTRLVKGLAAVVEKESGEGDVLNHILDGLRDDPAGPKVDLRKGMIDQLGDSMLHFMDGKHPPDRKASAIRRASLFPIADEVKFATAADTLWSGVALAAVHGYKTFVCPIDQELLSRTEFRAASIWTKEKTFAIGNNKDFFAHLFNGMPVTPLTETADFKYIDNWWKKVESEETCVYAYFSPEHLLGNAYQEVVDAKVVNDAKGRPLPEHPATPYLRFLLLGEMELQNATKPMSLPEADVIMSNWPALGWTLANSEKGMRFELVWLGANRKPASK